MNKNNFITGLIALLLVSGFMSSCKKDRVIVNSNAGDLYQSFMPLEIGKFIVYDVDSFLWDDVKCIKYTNESQQEYLVADTFRDNQKRLSYMIQIRSRANEKAAWTVNDVVYYTPGAEQLELVEKNIRYMRLVNPIVENKQWLGNSLIPQEDQDYNYLKGWKYTYQNVLQPFNNGAITFDRTVTVLETDQILNNPETMPDSYAYLLQSKSVYAFRVGMIYHEYAYWIYDPVPLTKSCRRGAGVTMRAIEYN